VLERSPAGKLVAWRAKDEAINPAGHCLPGQPRRVEQRLLRMTSTPPVVNRLLETSLYVEVLDHSIAFYLRVFGFAVLLRDDYMCAMAVPDRQVLLLFQKGGSTELTETPFGFIPPPHDAHRTQHLCFSITHDRLNAWQDHLQDLDITLESRLDWGIMAAPASIFVILMAIHWK
jgi:catechol 2,3-dioxygenase-like lactoylglutathione lyase family enzyme